MEDIEKCFRQKLHDLEEATFWLYCLSSKWKRQKDMKVTSTFLKWNCIILLYDMIPLIILHIKVLY